MTRGFLLSFIADLLTKPFNINLGEHLFCKGNTSFRQKVDNVKVSKRMGDLGHDEFIFQLTHAEDTELMCDCTGRRTRCARAGAFLQSVGALHMKE